MFMKNYVRGHERSDEGLKFKIYYIRDRILLMMNESKEPKMVSVDKATASDTPTS